MKHCLLLLSIIALPCSLVAMERSRGGFAVPALHSPDMPIAAAPRQQSVYSLDQALAQERRRHVQVHAAQLAAKLALVAAAQETGKK